MASKLEKIRDEIRPVIIGLGFQKGTGVGYNYKLPNGNRLKVEIAGNNFKLIHYFKVEDEFGKRTLNNTIKSIPMSKIREPKAENTKIYLQHIISAYSK
jgi:hypothetical protein